MVRNNINVEKSITTELQESKFNKLFKKFLGYIMFYYLKYYLSFCTKYKILNITTNIDRHIGSLKKRGFEDKIQK